MEWLTLYGRLGLVVVAVLLHRIASSSTDGAASKGSTAAAFLIIVAAVGTILGALWEWSPAVQMLCLGIAVLAVAQVWAGAPSRAPERVVIAEPLTCTGSWLRPGRDSAWELLEDGPSLGPAFRDAAEETVDSDRPAFRDRPRSSEGPGEFRRASDRLATPVPPA